MAWRFALYGVIFAGLGVALGAFGAHALKQMLSEHLLTVYETGVRYQMYHAFGLLFLSFLADRFGEQHARALKWAGNLMVAGIVIFSGSLYALSISGIKPLGAITPLGGVAFIAAWSIVAVMLAKKVT